MKYFKIVLVIIIAAGAIVRLFHLSNASWIKLAGGIAFVIYLILWIIDSQKKRTS